MLTPVRSAAFKRDVRRVQKRGKDLNRLRTLLLLLLEGTPLPARYKDHPLKGKWAGFRDTHIEPDWLLIYRIEGDELQLARTVLMQTCSTNKARGSSGRGSSGSV